MRHLLVVVLCLAAAPASFALDAAHPDWSGWRQRARADGLKGVFANRGNVAMWSASTYHLSDDAGWTWTEAAAPAIAAPSPAIAQIVRLSRQRTYIRLANGVVLDPSGNQMNGLWMGGQAIGRIVVDQQDVLFAERGDRQRTVAVADGSVRAEAPGRLAGIFQDRAVVMQDQQAWALTADAAKPIRTFHRGEPAPGSWPMQTGPGAAVWRDAAGIGWSEAMADIGELAGVEVLCHAHWGWENRIVSVMDYDGRRMVLSARPEETPKPGPWSAGAPAGIIAIAGIAEDPDQPTSPRLVAVTPLGLFLWRPAF